jgi:hypothetical protein
MARELNFLERPKAQEKPKEGVLEGFIRNINRSKSKSSWKTTVFFKYMKNNNPACLLLWASHMGASGVSRNSFLSSALFQRQKWQTIPSSLFAGGTNVLTEITYSQRKGSLVYGLYGEN